jgi:murein DD-endopeptidase MepM/ murein hydrolase activator NlpD
MKETDFPIPTQRERQETVATSPHVRSIIPRFMAWCMVAVWRMGVDWRAKRPFLIRFTAHFSIIILTLAAIGLSGIGVSTPQAAGGRSPDANAFSFRPVDQSEPEPTLPPPVNPTADWSHPPDTDTVARLPVPHTLIPDRLRAEVITYAVQPGDTIFDIATRFGLSPATIVWSNREALQDAPWLLQLGLELYIPPVDGIYHTVRAEETVASIAAEYEVDPDAIYNEWNDLEEDEPLYEGQLLVVPDATGDEIAWTPPEPESAVGTASYSYGVCSGVTFTGPGANGWFVLPTGSPRVSGWYFRDPRNPGHIGLDYACRMGDPLYASDNGVVSIAGWNGGYGILVEVNHGNGFVTRYGHFSDILVGCGQAVYQGQLLGYCGSTGYSSGAHLHFEVRYNGVPQDPQNYLP